MSDHRAIRFLDPTRGEYPCSMSQWRHLTGDLCVCDVCDDPPITCYAKQQDYRLPCTTETPSTP